MLKQRFLEASRQRLIARIERGRKSRVILLVHRQETMSVLGFPLLRYTDVNDSEEVLRAIHLTDPAVPLDIVLHTPGGLVLASLQIARAIHKQELARLLSEGRWTHDHPITCDALKSLGLLVRSDIPAEFLDLLSLLPQPVRRQPAVEYLPVPRRVEGNR